MTDQSKVERIRELRSQFHRDGILSFELTKEFDALLESVLSCIASHASTPAPTPQVGMSARELLMEIVKHTERGTVEDAIRLVKLGRGASAPTPSEGTKQQRLSKQCEQCADQLQLAIELSGDFDAAKAAKAADLMYAYMRDLFHEISESSGAGSQETR